MRTEVTSIKEITGLHSMGHTCANLNGELLFVWGGTSAGQQQQQMHEQIQLLQQQRRTASADQLLALLARNSDLWIYETLTGYWRHRTCTGQCPPYLSGCSSCLIGQRMFIFGGHSTALDDWLNCLFCLNLDTFVWTDLSAQAKANQPTKPIRSDKNVCWSYDNKLYIFGGYGWSHTENYMDILNRQRDFQLTPDFRWPQFGWNNQLVEFDPSDNNWRWPAYTGKCPSARAAHSGTLMSDGKFYLFGGRDSQQRLNDLYTLDMETLEWTQLAVFESLAPALRPIGHLAENRDNNNSNDDDDDNVELDGDEQGQEQENEREHAENGRIVDELREDNNSAEQEPELGEPMPSSSAAAGVSVPQRQLIMLGQYFDQSDNENEFDEDDDDDELVTRPAYLAERQSSGSGVTYQHTLESMLSDDFECLAQENGPTNGQGIQHTDHPHQAGEQQQQPEVSDSNIEAPVPLADAGTLNDGDNVQQANGHEVPGRPVHVMTQPVDVASCARPTGRSFCSFTSISDEDILLFGGVNSQDQNLDDSWQFNIKQNTWTPLMVNCDQRHRKPRLWHSGSRTKQNEVIIIGGSSSDKIDEFCTDVLVLSLEPKSLKRLALDAASRSIRLKTIQKCPHLPSTICKLIRLRKQAIALTSIRRSQHQTLRQTR